MNPQGLVLSNSQNTTKSRVIHNYSTFDKSLSYLKAMTLRFAEITPSFEMEGVPSDEVSVNSLDRIDSLSLKAPFKGQIRKIKQSFKVPKMAILPYNWDLIYTQPSNGDDVPSNAYCVLDNFHSNFSQYWQSLWFLVKTNSPTSTSSQADIQSWLTALARVLVLGEYVYSYGSLLNVCGYKIAKLFSQTYEQAEGRSYDDFFDRIIFNAFVSFYYGVELTWYDGSSTVSQLYYFTDEGRRLLGENSAPVRAFLDTLRENPTCFVTNIFLRAEHPTVSQCGQDIYDMVHDSTLTYPLFNNPVFATLQTHGASSDLTDMHPGNLDLSRVLAYQLTCAHFHSNSSVDFIYSAELYRQYVYFLGTKARNSGTHPSFARNGTGILYDALSGYCLSRQLYFKGNGNLKSDTTYAQLSGSDPSTDDELYRYASWAIVFGFRRSLRYGDYFVGSRPRPLAPINTDVSVSSNKVSVIDITRGIQSQRFANAVMRSRQKIEEYVEMMFGKKPDVDFHNPLYLSEEVETIFGDEVQNTGALQASDSNSRTSNFATQGLGRFTFTFNNDDMHECIYLQLISFDIRRAYAHGVDRTMLIADRYDMFNPNYQYIGDQPVYGVELCHPLNLGGVVPDVFAYQTRDAEYKQKYDVCSGGFGNKQLPGWLLTDHELFRQSQGVLNPDFIRNMNFELDGLFLALNGYSLGNYFHFICITHNNVKAKRPMAVDPQILG